MKYLVLFLAISEVTGRLHEGPPHHHMSPRERDAFSKIEEVCQDDMERHCRPSQEARADPLLQWMMAPERLAPPMLHPEALEPMDPINIGPLVDHMLDTALRLPMMMQPEPEPVFFLILDDSPPEAKASDEFILDSMVSRLMQQSDCDKNKQMMEAAAKEPLDDIMHHIRLKGQEIFEQEDAPEDRRRLARRLTEVTPEEMMVHFQQPIHPFFRQEIHQPHSLFFEPPRREHHHICPRKHKCLMQAREQNQLRPGCHGALTRLEKVQEYEKQQREEMDLYMSLFWLYCALFFCLFTMIILRRFKGSKGLFLLRLRVLQAVYSNPEIKAKVEDEVGAPLGDVPPLPSVALKMLSRDGRNQCRAKRQRFCRLLYAIMFVLALDAFGYLPSSWPLLFMGGCCVFMVVRMFSICCCSQPEVRECKCCCCGGSTWDVENGTVSDAQACCTCCKGSGICAVKCKSCCTGGSCRCGKSGCDGSCDCCGDPKAACGYTLLSSDDCKCCCCGASTIDAAKGVLTNAQACCTCCKGTGICDAKCKSCFGKGGACDGSCDCDCCGKSCNFETVKVGVDCKCCCCGSTAANAAKGLLTDAQACCTCCKGTGTCSAKCKSCCGKGGACDGSCDCDCCGKSKTVAVKVADDCKCCCCGATAADAAKGLLTDGQACCTCCKGTGTCSAKCKNCCGKGSACDGSCDCDCCGQSKVVVYEGISIQIV